MSVSCGVYNLEWPHRATATLKSQVAERDYAAGYTIRCRRQREAAQIKTEEGLESRHLVSYIAAASLGAKFDGAGVFFDQAMRR